MYFKSLELFGFKSFADRTKLEFEPGVTAIVGPNGCGKSNFSDSIRWVLGEQNPRVLRATKMEDIIFNGTAGKPPLNFAEVCLTLSNEDKALPIEYEEVAILRRGFRSGESEYFINKTPVRLKDITELLMGTGIGRASYSLLEQGKIDLILSSKPEDRRFIFEEAAGITRYKAKRGEALRRLEDTEENLLRLQDIIGEIKRQLASVERQVAKARRYKEQFDGLKECEIKLAIYQDNVFEKKKGSFHAESGRLEAREAELTAELNKVEAATKELQKEAAQIDAGFAQATSQIFGIQSRADRNLTKIDIYKERAQENKERMTTLNKEILLTREKISDIKKRVQDEKNTFLAIEEEEGSSVVRLDEKETERRRLREEMEKLLEEKDAVKIRIMDVTRGQTEIRNEMAKVSGDIHAHSVRKRRLELEQREIAGQQEKIAERDVKLSESLCCIQGILTGLEPKKEELRERLEAVESECLRCLKNLEKINRQIESDTSKLQFLEALSKRYEGYGRGVKAILKELDEPGILGTVADIIEVKAGYGLAVQIALGYLARALVVKDSITLEKIVGYLKEKNRGGACLICLDCIEKKASQEAPPSLERLANFVSAKPEYEKLIQHLLQGVYLAGDFQMAFRTVKNYRNIRAVVTARGELLTLEGVYRIEGKEALEEGPLSRKGEIENLKLSISSAVQKIELEKTAEKENGNIFKQIKDELKDVEIQINETNIERADLTAQESAFHKDKERLSVETSVVEGELTETQDALEDLTGRKEDLEERLAEGQRENAEIEGRIAEIENLTAAKRAQREGLMVEITRLQTEAASLDKRRASHERSLAVLDDSLREQVSLRNSREEELKTAAARIETVKVDIENFEKENTGLAEEKRGFEAEKAGIQSEKDALLKRITFEEEEYREKRRQLETLKDEMRNQSLNVAQIDFQREGLREKLSTVYNIDFNEQAEKARGAITGEEEARTLKEEITHSRQKLERMGAVNLVVIEEHKELQERFQFLTKQHEDLLAAKDSLRLAIEKINRTSKKLFMDTFTAVQKTFKIFFRQLFGGGMAELLMQDETDMLNSGIEIVACPPGKKSQNISLLSGGEKSLTAIALLFAVFKVKPSPFCVLDEMDAALDEANIGRFTQVLQDFVKQSQFIIITHNKKTISMADVMYGVTMVESGTSRIVSVKFKESKEKKLEIRN